MMPASSVSPPTVAFVTLGCAKNEVDTETMERSLALAGYALADDAAAADFVVVNTCAFIEPAVEEALDAILDLADTPRVRSGAQKLVVSGCLPARYGDDLALELPEVAAFVPCAQEGNLANILAELGAQAPAMAALDRRQTTLQTRHPSFRYVKISEGCDRRCTFCTIPAIRGPHVSRSLEELLAEVAAARELGCVEFDLIAQDTGRWGADLKPKMALPELMKALESSFGDRWFRLLYLQPDALDEPLLKTLAASRAFCHYLDIPIQHVDRDILRAMGRGGSLESLHKMATALRETVDDITLRTTLIVGFPGETPEAFDALCDFVAEGLFDYVGIFPFSPEESTIAAGLPNQIDEDERLHRWQMLRDIADEVGSAAMARRIGQRVEVLIDEVDETDGRVGHTRFQAPEVDGVTFLTDGKVGEIVTATIDDAFGYDLEGR